MDILWKDYLLISYAPVISLPFPCMPSKHYMNICKCELNKLMEESFFNRLLLTKLKLVLKSPLPVFLATSSYKFQWLSHFDCIVTLNDLDSLNDGI